MNLKRIKIQYNSPVVLTFTVISFFVLLLNMLTNGQSTRMLFCVYRSPLTDLFTYPRFFLHVLGHGSYEHYISNILLLLVVGPPLEEKYGSQKILLSILITALITGLVQYIFFPASALLGASGIVFMMIVMSSYAGKQEKTIPITLILVIVLYLGGEIVDGLAGEDGVSQVTHIIGGICGAVLGAYFIKQKSY